MDYNITYRQKDKGWQYIISYKDKNGKWRQKSKQGFKNKKEAKPYAELALKKLKESENLNQDLKEITFKDFTDMYLKHISLQMENNTVRLYKMALKHFTDLNNMEMSSIATMHIQKCIDAMIENKLAYSTIRTYKNRITAIFNKAVTQFNVINRSPAINLTIKINKEPSHKKALTQIELKDLLKKSKNIKYKTMFALAGMCGLRLGEMLGLTWDKIDFINNTVTIDKQWKNKSDGTVGFGVLKTKNSYRTVPLPKEVKNILLEYRNYYPIDISNRVIPYKCIAGITQMLKNYAKKIGFNFSIHELRHTYATTLIANNVDFKTTAALMGHDVEQTMKTYSHVTSEMMDNAKKIINKVF